MTIMNLSLVFKMIDNVTKPLKQVSSKVSSITTPVSLINNRFKSLKNNVINSVQPVNALRRSVDRVKDATKAASDSFKNMQKRTESIKGSFDKMKGAGMGMSMMGAAMTAPAIAMGFSAMNFEEGLASASTMTDFGFEEFKNKYNSELLDIVQNIGSTSQLVTDAAYQALSGNVASEEVIDFLNDAGKAAIAGRTDILTAVDGLSGAREAWKSYGYTVNEISDLAFTAIRRGKLNFSELSRSIGQFGSTATSAGVRIEEVFSAISTVTTTSNKSAAEAATGIKMILASLIAPTSQAEKAFESLGITINAETLKNKGLQNTLMLVKNAMNDLPLAKQNALISDMFGSTEALTTVLSITGEGAKHFSETLNMMKTSAGSTNEQYEKMAQTASFQYKQLKASISVVAITLGSILLPTMKMFFDILKTILTPIRKFTQAFPVLSKLILITAISTGVFLTALGSTLMAIGFVGSGIMSALPILAAFKTGVLVLSATLSGSLISAFVAAKAAIISFSATIFAIPGIGWILAAITLVIGATIFLVKNWDWVKNKTVQFWNWFISLFARLGNFIASINFFDAGKNIITSIVSGIKSVALSPVSTVKSIVQKVRNLLPFSPAKDGPLKDIHKIKLIETIASGINPIPLYSTMKNIVGNVRSLMIDSVPFNINSLIPGSFGSLIQRSEPVNNTLRKKESKTITLHYSPSINIEGDASENTLEKFKDLLKTHKNEVIKLLKDIEHDKTRRAY